MIIWVIILSVYLIMLLRLFWVIRYVRSASNIQVSEFPQVILQSIDAMLDGEVIAVVFHPAKKKIFFRKAILESGKTQLDAIVCLKNKEIQHDELPAEQVEQGFYLQGIPSLGVGSIFCCDVTESISMEQFAKTWLPNFIDFGIVSSVNISRNFFLETKSLKKRIKRFSRVKMSRVDRFDMKSIFVPPKGEFFSEPKGELFPDERSICEYFKQC